LSFIRQARDLGFSLQDVRDLLGVSTDQPPSCRRVQRAAVRQISEIRRRIHELGVMERMLVELSSRCHGEDRPDCPVIEELGGRT
jgi:DNA-binding transcriptional MerR regulator